MKTISIIGTDWRGPESFPHSRRKPFHSLDRTRVEDWRNVFYELCTIARIPCLAVGIRGAYDDYDRNWHAPAKAAWEKASPQPTLIPWFDTVGLPDMVNAPNSGTYKFDFANDEHIQIGWEKYARVFFDAFAGCTFERTPNWKVLCAWWGIETPTGHGFRNQHQAQRLLDYINEQCAVLGLGGADHIVDHTWLKECPGVQVFGVHDWFNGWSVPPVPYTIRQHHNGNTSVTVGVTVPSFYDRINPEGNAETIRTALAAMRAAKVDYILMESGTNFQEDAELMRDASGNTHKLDAVREHIELLTPIGVLGMSAAGSQPLFTFDHRAVIRNNDGTISLRWNAATGKTDHTSDRVFSLQSDGSYGDRPLVYADGSSSSTSPAGVHGWEKGRPEDGRFLVFRAEEARVVFPWQD